MANLNWLKISFVAVYLLSAGGLVHSYVASSTNYVLQSDSVNFGGGYSTSTSYGLQDTLGEIGTAILSSSTSILSSGYQAMPLDTYLAISSPADVTMAPALVGTTGGTSNGEAGFQVQTDNPAGYELSIKANTSPALAAGANSFADYTPSFSDPDYTWNTPVTESRFGFSPEGSDLITTFKDNGVSCNTGSLDTTDKCWKGLSTTDQVMARATTANYPTGATTTVKFRAEVGTSKTQEQGSYSATVTVTAVTL